MTRATYDPRSRRRRIGRTNAIRLSSRFFNDGQIAPGRWTEGAIETPPGMLAHHANHVVGVPAKISDDE